MPNLTADLTTQAVGSLRAELDNLEGEWKGEAQGAKAHAQALQKQLATVQARMSDLAGRLLTEINKADQLRQSNFMQAEVRAYFRASSSLCLGFASVFQLHTSQC